MRRIFWGCFLAQWCLVLGATEFQVHPTNRSEVRAFFKAVYHASDEIPLDSSAKVGMCVPGTNSTAFQEAVLDRINWFRAMAGVPATVAWNEDFSRDAQLAATMMSAQGAWSHTPPSSWPCWSVAGSNAAYNSNLIIDRNGWEAIDSYIDDFGSANGYVGHRRWLLYPQTQMMGTGDVPGQNGRPPANATWILDGNLGTARPPTRQPEVAWPPAGFVPYPVVFRRWSFSYPGASFINTTISLRSNGAPVTVARESVVNGYGENTVVWVPGGLDPNTAGYQWPRPAEDIVYSIALSNVFIRGGSSNFNYTVTVFDPDRSGDAAQTTVVGPGTILVGATNMYTCAPVSYATRYEWRASRPTPLVLMDGAENGTTNFAVTQSPGYSVVLGGAGVNGSRAFHLAHPEPLGRQSLRFMTTLLPSANAMLLFKSRLGFAGDGEFARVQVSTDDGNSWIDEYVQRGTGNAGETSYHSRSVGLSNYVGRSIQLRFTYDFWAGGFFSATTAASGWLLDDIVLSNCEALQDAVVVTADGTTFNFVLELASRHWLEVRGVMFDDFPLAWGPGLNVTSVSVPRLSFVTRTGQQIQIEFTAGNVAGIQLQNAADIRGPWSVDPLAVLGTNAVTGRARFTTELGQGAGYFRLAVP